MPDPTDETRQQAAPVKMPPDVRRLRCDAEGRPIPWGMDVRPDGQPAWGYTDRERVLDAMRRRLCWLCGQRINVHLRSFLLAPSQTITRLSSEPPCHRACAEYAARTCPFMLDAPAGPVAVWTVDQASIEAIDGPQGIVFRLGAPRIVSWWVFGVRPVRDDVTLSLAKAFARLCAEADGASDDPERTRGHLQDRLRDLSIWLPAPGDASATAAEK